ncbi:MAG TPA: 30S ribosomal protein S6 [Thermoanaerobaculia bacterium]|nr:30S ribosomal protein S6 [Thermoanaerobaculia bacterium]
MTRTYELALVIDPRISDEESVTLTDGFKDLLTTGGARITKEENWGKKRLAYTIDKLNEGRYTFLFFDLDVDGKAKNPIPEVELRLRQNDKILRYLTVRTDLDLKRAANKGGKVSTSAGALTPEEPAAEEGWEKE